MPASIPRPDTAAPTIVEVLTGEVRPLGPRSAPSAIHKTAAGGPVRVGREGLDGDQQGDRKNHGGPEKAVHLYPSEHYAHWRTTLGPHPLLAGPGGFGENVATAGLAEADVAVGDRFRLGTAVVEVSQGRQPCWKLDARFGVRDLALQVQRTGRTGWYCRVLVEGVVTAGDPLVLVERRAPEWTLERLWHALYVDTLDLDELAAMADLEPLAEAWRRHARRRVETRTVEDWSRRLDGA